MNDISETFKDLRHAAQSKREHNRRYSTKLLSAKRVKFKAVNNGYHLIITHRERTVDFWPSTGLWKVRNADIQSRGVKSLLEYLEDGNDHSSNDRSD